MPKNYETLYSEESLFNKLKKFALVAGSKVVYAVLLLYYLLIEESTPTKVRISIAGALGYFILPIDAIPDLTPIIGYTDDLGVLIFALTQFAIYLTPKIKEKAKTQLAKWFSNIVENDLKEIEKNIEPNN